MTSTSSTSSCWISSDSLTTISSTFADPENGTTTCSFGTFTAAESSLLSLLSSLPSESQSASSSSSTSTTTTLTTTAFDSSTSVTSLTSASISISSTNNSTTTANSTTSMAGILTLTDILSSLLPSLSLPESSPVQTPPVSPPPSPPTPTPAPTTVPEPISTSPSLVPPAEPSSTPGLSPLPPETVSPTLGTTSVFTTLSSSGLIIPSPPLSPSITQLTTPAAFSARSSTRVSRTTITARPSGTPAVTPNPTGSLFPSPGWPSGSAFARNPRAIAGLVVGLTIALLFAIAWVFLARRRRQQRALFRRERQSHRPSVRSRHGIGVAIAESTESLYSRDSERVPLGSEVDPEMAERVSIDGSVGDRPEHYASPLTPFTPTMRTGLMEGEPGAGGAGTGYSENGYSTSQRERVERSSSSLSTPFQPAVGGLTLTQAAAVIASSRSGEGSRSGQLGTSVGASSGSRSGGPGIAVPEPAVAGPSRSEGSLIPRAEPYAYQPRRHGSTSPYEPTTAHQEYVHVEDEPPSPSSSRSVVGRGLRGLIGRMSRRSAPPAMQRRRGPSLTIQVPVSGTGSGFPVVLLDGQEVEEHPFRRGLLTPGIESGTSFRDDFDYSTPIAGPVHNTSIAPSSVAPSTFGDRDSFG